MRFVPTADPAIFVNLSNVDTLSVIEDRGGHSAIAIKFVGGDDEIPVKIGLKLYTSDTNCSKENCVNYIVDLIEEMNEC